jgi:hypothetical protein
VLSCLRCCVVALRYGVAVMTATDSACGDVGAETANEFRAWLVTSRFHEIHTIRSRQVDKNGFAAIVSRDVDRPDLTWAKRVAVAWGTWGFQGGSVMVATREWELASGVEVWLGGKPQFTPLFAERVLSEGWTLHAGSIELSEECRRAHRSSTGVPGLTMVTTSPYDNVEKWLGDAADRQGIHGGRHAAVVQRRMSELSLTYLIDNGCERHVPVRHGSRSDATIPLIAPREGLALQHPDVSTVPTTTVRVVGEPDVRDDDRRDTRVWAKRLRSRTDVIDLEATPPRKFSAKLAPDCTLTVGTQPPSPDDALM